MKNDLLYVILMTTLAMVEIVAAAFWISALAVPAIIAGKIFKGVVNILTAWIWAYWGFSHLDELKEDK